jgi:cytochrome c553
MDAAAIARLVAGTALSLLTLCGPSRADERQVAYGRHLAQECTSCHRIDGVDNGIPSIIGQDAEAFADTIRFYQSGARTNAAMVSVAQSLDEEQIKALAAYYAGLPKPAAKPVAKAKAGASPKKLP